jgi:putative SOS response-associated peptidase YedK
MFSYSEVVAFSQPLGSTDDDREMTYRVVNELPIIVLNIVDNKRQVIPMRWGFPDAKDWRRPKPIHARSETIDTTKAFAQSFADGQRGIVLMKTFMRRRTFQGQRFNTQSRPMWF